MSEVEIETPEAELSERQLDGLSRLFGVLIGILPDGRFVAVWHPCGEPVKIRVAHDLDQAEIRVWCQSDLADRTRGAEDRAARLSQQRGQPVTQAANNTLEDMGL